MDDWIKLHRSLLDDGLWQLLTGEQAKAFVGLLLSVNWKPSEFGCRQCREVFQLPPGATARSYNTLAEIAGVSPGVMKRLIKTLCDAGFIINDSRPRCHTIYLVKNWDKYQRRDPTPDPTTTPTTTLVATPTPTQRRPCEEEGKKERREELPLGVIEAQDGSLSDAAAAADHLRELLRGAGKRVPEDMPWQTGLRLNWAREIQQGARRHGIPAAEHPALMDKAFSLPAWEGREGDTLDWPSLIGRASNPATYWVTKAKAIEERRGRAPKHNLEVEYYSPGPHAAATPIFKLNGREIEGDRYRELAKENKANGY